MISNLHIGTTRILLSSRGVYKKFGVRGYSQYNRFQSNKTNHFHFFNNRVFLGIGAGLIGFYVYNQNEAPFTHRRRFLWVPYWMEKRIGDMSYRQIMYQYQQYLVPRSDPVYRQIGKVVDKLLAHSFEANSDESQVRHLKLLNWEIHVINLPNTPPNAFILPNGKIFMFASILPICKDSNGIATVLSHELSHQLAHHSMEQMSKQPFYIALLTLLYMATGVSWFNELLIAGFLTMPASREMELEADRIGCELMARLCYNLNQIPNFWLRMYEFEQRAGGRKAPLLQEFLSTHPNTTKRIKDIQSWMPELQSIKETLDCHQFNEFRGFF